MCYQNVFFYVSRKLYLSELAIAELYFDEVICYMAFLPHSNSE